jgi:hypothetical protein
MDMVTQVTAKVNELFNKQYLSKLAKETGFIKRERKIDAKSFLEKLIQMRLNSPNESLEVLADEFEEEGLTITKQALHKKFNKNTLGFMRGFLDALLKNLANAQKLELRGYSFIKNIHTIDSSEIKLNKLHKSAFPQVCKQGAAVKLQALMEALSNQIKLLEIRPSKEPDQGYKKHVSHIQAGDLLIGDLGYFCVATFKTIIDKEAFFLSRYFKKTHLYHPITEEKIDLRALLGKTKKKIIDIPINLAAAKVPCRLVAMRLTKSALKKRLKHLAERDRRHERTGNNQDILNGWTIFVTNLPLSIKGKSLLKIYSLRWQIELFFKVVKTLLKLRTVENLNPNRAIISIYISLIAVTLVSYVVRSITDKEVSFYKACKIFVKNIRKFFVFFTKSKKHAIFWLRKKFYKFALKESRANRLSTRASIGVPICLS